MVSEHLEFLYGLPVARAVMARLEQRLAAHRQRNPAPIQPPTELGLSQEDALLIAYGDHVRQPGRAPLQSLGAFCEQHLKGVISGIHVLPHYPSTSDDGFSVTDYSLVNPELGTWDDLARLSLSFDLMLDAVFNHMSAGSQWFQKFLKCDPAYRDFFITVEGEPNLSQVVRPRALPLLTEFMSGSGPVKVWTTFSADQVDLNFRNPEVLLAVLDALLFYVEHGARFIRLDAIAYLWKQIGTPCIHLPQTHRIIQLMRAVLDEVAPQVMLITETNVPHADNLSYFGDGTNEAQLVYNFALPPLSLHALLRGDSTRLTRWAQTLTLPSDRVTLFNFLASHDGIGLNPARGILPDQEIDFLVERCQAHGGFISYKNNPDGAQTPYEMNTTWFDALNDPRTEEPLMAQANRFLVSQAIMLALQGVPGIYFHSLFGSRNDRSAALATGVNRRINRQKFDRSNLETRLADRSSLDTRRAKVRPLSPQRQRRRSEGNDPVASGRAPDICGEFGWCRRVGATNGSALWRQVDLFGRNRPPAPHYRTVSVKRASLIRPAKAWRPVISTMDCGPGGRSCSHFSMSFAQIVALSIHGMSTILP
jgi:sucrose phosphorylase